MLNMGQGHHLQLKYHLLLFHNFRWLNMKASLAHHPVTQKDVAELLGKGTIDPSTGGPGFYSHLHMVPYCTGGF